MKTNIKNKLSGKIVFIALITVLSGCSFLTKKKVQPPKVSEVIEEQEVLLSIEGKPVITAKKFEGHLQKIVDANPQIKGVLESVPAVKYNIFSGMVGQELLRAWAQEQKITEKTEYQEDYTMALQLLEYELARKYFTQGLEKEVEVTDEEIKRYYHASKSNIPDMVVSPGGVKAFGIAFNNGIESAAFEQSLGRNQERFKEAALASKRSIKDFGLVTSYTVDIDKSIKRALLAIRTEKTKLASVKTEDGKFWVCYAHTKQEPEYRSLDEVKSGIENSLKQEKMQIAYGSKVEALKTVYRAQENKEYFEADSAKELLAQQEQEDTPESEVKRPATQVA